MKRLMKLNYYLLAIMLAASALGGNPAHAQKKNAEQKIEKVKVKAGKIVERGEASIAVSPTVVVTLCTESGRITVRGGEHGEVRARTPKGAKIGFRRTAEVDAATPATRIEVLIAEAAGEDEKEPHFGRCSGMADIELDVPRMATLFIKSQEGEISIDNVAEAHLETSSGKISARRVTRAIEASSNEGDLSLEDSSGRVSLESFNGSVEASNISKIEESDFFRAKSISNDVLLDRVSHARVEASTISGEIMMRGPLARSGRYDFRTISGDITLTMPADSSFQLTSKVSVGGEIVTDFPLKFTGAPTPVGTLSSGRMKGSYGKGDATINLISFSGTLRLRRK